jgi:hypothetical protein
VSNVELTGRAGRAARLDAGGILFTAAIGHPEYWWLMALAPLLA